MFGGYVDARISAIMIFMTVVELQENYSTKSNTLSDINVTIQQVESRIVEGFSRIQTLKTM